MTSERSSAAAPSGAPRRAGEAAARIGAKAARGGGAAKRAEITAIVLAAGEGRRLRPLTEVRPKALCPVGNVTLLDRMLARLTALGLAGPDRVAVNACYLGDQV